MNEVVKPYFAMIDWDNPKRGHVYGIRSQSGRWATRVFEFYDELGRPLPNIVSWRGTDDAIVDFFHDYLEDNAGHYEMLLAQYMADIADIDSL